ncbi:uncharacterized protein HMPREF1541_08553 [Cyphellophora europaea CBS 101466]|uniref:Protein MON2 homolog n=1 Tax=Cyphellophora europaea (strain CBS 101466) TaxID=1220924 RepID=W2RIH3_CYPE1|nr:uncharacterized protein HMPREF1541_08553 [Cyphellophora europaea CBS 101466]ETN36276.1 hypothetical protein HMPREF1541_08553 [Cyphellophora europaea CBS 101466]
MTSAFLQSELTSLIADSKKKFGDVKIAAEKSLADLKNITVTSETQVAADLNRRPHFIDPFLLACQTKSPKLANSATACLQRLIASRGVSPERLEEVLDALKDVVNASYDVQLKILQTLPALLQLYGTQIHGQLLARTLEICAILQSSKTPLVSSSAGATLWQLIASVFEEASHEQTSSEVTECAEDESQTRASTSADDAGRLFEDLCSALNQTEPTFIKTGSLSPAYLVETLQKVIDGHASYIRSKPYLLEACRTQLLPAIAGLLENRDDFAFMVLLLETSYTLLQKLAPLLFTDLSPVLSIILGFTDRDAGPLWKRALALEFLSRIFSNFGLVARLFDELKDDAGNIVTDALASFVRIASEDPALIGLGRQSTVPAQHRNETREDDMAAIEAQGVGGGLASVTSAEVGVTGISLEFSTMDATLLDTADASRLNAVPKTYLSTLVLECISSLCEGLSKFIMPLSVLTRNQEDGDDGDEDTENGTERRSQSVTRTSSQRRRVQKHKYQRLANPLSFKDLPQLPQVQACARMVESCWPAILAMCSTFLNAALDSHFYHILIRSIQKLTQVSGTLELSTPRDALLTSLAKGSVPPNASSVIQLSSPVAKRHHDPSGQQNHREPLKSPTSESYQLSLQTPRQTLNVRHLLCLRALLNLGIALGPTLGSESWFIVIETLQQVEALMTIASIGQLSGVAQEGQNTLTGEMAAVNTASKRMFESTRSYTNEAFAIVISSLFRLMGEAPEASNANIQETAASPATLASPSITSPIVRKHGHRASRSVSGLWVKTKALDVEVSFVFAKLKDLSRVNLCRFTSVAAKHCTWDLVIARLLKASKSPDLNDSLRLQAAKAVDLVATETIKLLDHAETSADDIDNLQNLSLEALATQVVVEHTDSHDSGVNPFVQSDITKLVFEALEDILGHSGETLRSGWTVVFRILSRSFESVSTASNGDAESDHAQFAASTPVAFRCVQLICNDFIQSLNLQSLGLLIPLMYLFGSQQQDLNMALTATGLLRNTATLLQGRLGAINVTDDDFSEIAENGEGSPSFLQLWCAALTELAKMCSDPRREVRDASLRTLLQSIEGASGQLAPSSWGPLLEAVPFSISQVYQSAMSQRDIDHEALSTTAAHLLEGTTSLFVQNMEVMATDNAFPDTWSRLIDIFNVTLEGGELTTFTLVYNCVSQLLKAIRAVKTDHVPLVQPALLLWTWHPVPEHQKEGSDEPNQAALTAHLHMFVEAYGTSPATVTGFSHHRRSMSEYLTTAVRQALLTATHPPYTNDVRTMTPEQQEIISTLEILKVLFKKEPENFSGFVLELIQDMLDIEKGSLKPRVEELSRSKRHQKPTYIAVASHCIDLLRKVLVDIKSRPDFINMVQLPYALDMLSAIIKTKYTPLPTNAINPIWRNATTAAVDLVEATSTPPAAAEDLADLSQTLTAAVTAILGPGGLPPVPTSSCPSEDTLVTDESFDTSHFERFHQATLPLLTTSTPEAQRSYIVALFRASLLAPPWYGDLPDPAVLLSAPLSHITTQRPGTVHNPVFVRRERIAYSALDALFALVCPTSNNELADEDQYKQVHAGYNSAVAAQAALYVLLRIAGPMKAFLADQPSRGWTPMPRTMQREMEAVLRRAVELRGDDVAFRAALAQARAEGNATAVAEGGGASDRVSESGSKGKSSGDAADRHGDGVSDGKEHLRALYTLVLRVQREWRGAMRVPGGKGWMDAEDGVGRKIETCLDRWVEAVGGDWGVNVV